MDLCSKSCPALRGDSVGDVEYRMADGIKLAVPSPGILPEGVGFADLASKRREAPIFRLTASAPSVHQFEIDLSRGQEWPSEFSLGALLMSNPDSEFGLNNFSSSKLLGQHLWWLASTIFFEVSSESSAPKWLADEQGFPAASSSLDTDSFDTSPAGCLLCL